MTPFQSIHSLIAALALSFIFMACGTESSAVDTENAVPATEEPVEDAADQRDEGTDDDHNEDDDHDDDVHTDEEADHDHDAEAASGLGAHEHGVAELSVAWTGNDMVVDLISPAVNIFGFEYEPVSDEDVALVAERTEALSDPAVVAVNDEANCELADDVRTEFEVEGSHAEVTASWVLTCGNPGEIRQLDTARLFAEFPNLEDIDVQWVSDTAQSSAELSPSSTVLDLG